MTQCHVPDEPTIIHPALAGRYSPVRFNSTLTLTTAEVHALLDAARHAPSAGNSQPWKFIVARRGDANHQRIVRRLARSSSLWAPAASLLVVNLAHTLVEGTADWEYSEFARYDLGQAVAHMTFQGLAMGLAAHQFRAFDRDGVTSDFVIPHHWEVTSITAFGTATHAAGELASSGTSRERMSLDEIIWS